MLARVAEDVFDEAIDPKFLSSYLAETNHHMFVAVREGEVVGQIRAVIIKNPDAASQLYIDNLGVTAKLQRQGIATELLKAVMNLGKLLGCEGAWLGTEVDNLQAKGFYESFGVTLEPMVIYQFKV